MKTERKEQIKEYNAAREEVINQPVFHFGKNYTRTEYLANHRLPDEPQDAYKARRFLINKVYKEYLQVGRK